MSKIFARIFIGIVIVVAVGYALYLGLILGIAVWFESADRGGKELQAKLDSLRAAGAPVDNASLTKWHEQQTDPTHTDAWLKIFQTIQSPEFLQQAKGVARFDPKVQETKRTTSGWPEEAAVRKLLAESTELRKEIHQLAKARLPVRFPLHFNGISTDIDHIQQLRQVVRLMAYELDAAIVDRNSPQIAASAQTLLDLAVLLRGEPFIVQQLMSVSIRGMAMVALQEALQHDLLAPAELDILAKTLPLEPVLFDDYQKLVQAERAILLSSFLERLTVQKDPKDKARKQLGNKTVASVQDTLNMLKYMQRYEELQGLAPGTMLARAEELTKDLDKDIKDAGKWRVREWMVTNVAFPSWLTNIYNMCFETHRRNMVLHGIALRRYKNQFGEFPPDLAALKAVDFDTNQFMPIGTKPIGYQRTETEIIFWSNLPKTGVDTSEQPPPILSTSSDPRQDQLVWKMAR